MSDDERTVLINEIQAWRDAVHAYAEGSPRHHYFQNKMKLAEWKLHALGPPKHPPGVVIEVVNPEKTAE